MAYGNPAGAGPATSGGENLYDDGPESGDVPAADEQEAPGGETALVPKSLCPGMKPGDTLELKIDRVHDDQYEVSYTPEAQEEETMEAPPEAAPDAEMQSMMG